MRSFVLIAMSAVVAAGAPAWGHGPQIQLTAEAGKIVTRQIMVDDYSPATVATSIYVLPVTTVSNRWLVQPPGTSGSGPGIAPGVGFVDSASHPFKSGNYTTSLVDGLKKWDGANFVDAGNSQLELYKTVNGAPATAMTTDSGPFASLTYSLEVTSDEAHTGMGYRFLGDGASSTSSLPDGVYLLSLKISTAGLTQSDPFYFVLPKGASAGETGVATFSLARQQGIGVGAIQAMTLMPEPSSLALAPLAIGGCMAVRRRPGNDEA